MAQTVIEPRPEERWRPVYTKPRCEKVVHDYCQRHGILCYLPLLRRAKRYQRRTVESFLPMFPGYVFAQLGELSKEIFLQSHKIVHILPVTGVQEEVLIRELRDLQGLENIQTETELVVLPDLTPGSSVVIVDGPFKGMNGIIDSRRNRTRITVNVEMLGQSVVAEMDIGEIERDTDGL